MTKEEFDKHLLKLEEREDINVWAKFNSGDDYHFKYRFFDNVLATVYFDPENDFLSFNQIDDEEIRLTSMTMRIEEEEYISGYSYLRNLSKKDKKVIIDIFLEKYGKPHGTNKKDFIWGFPSIKEPKYICRLDTSSMILNYSYNPTFLLPYLDNNYENGKKEERNKIKEVI